MARVREWMRASDLQYPQQPPLDFSRQQARAFFIRKAFADIDAKFGPEPRPNRRRMAIRIARRMAREFRAYRDRLLVEQAQRRAKRSIVMEQ